MNRDLFGEAGSAGGSAAGRARTAGTGSATARTGLGARATPQPYSVSAVNAMARELLESAVPPLLVRGEVTGWKRHSSGHCYFSLRDSDAQLRCVMFRREAGRLPADPDDGMEVRALGSLTIYERRGSYQLIVRELEGIGEGGLWRLAFERLREKLAAEGLLAPERKRPLPRHPRRVGIVTSPVGAALHDIVQIVRRRAPWTQLVLSPARVQGDGAADEIAAAIGLFARVDAADVLIVGRGGGSVEDLWAFNEEAVARAIAASPIPVVSAVGHEVDVTIADLIADLRAPTPSAAAEAVVPDRRAVARQLDELESRLRGAARRLIRDRRGSIDGLADALRRAVRGGLDRRSDRLAQVTGRLRALSPLAALERGYAVPQRPDGRILRSVRDFEPDAPFRLRLADGVIDARVDGVYAQEEDEANDG